MNLFRPALLLAVAGLATPAFAQGAGPTYLECDVYSAKTGTFYVHYLFKMGPQSWEQYDEKTGTWSNLCGANNCTFGDIGYEMRITIQMGRPGETQINTLTVNRVSGAIQLIETLTHLQLSIYSKGQCRRAAAPAAPPQRIF